MPAPRIKVEKNKLVELIEKRYNQREMAKMLSISVDTVSKLLRENNLSTKGIHEELIGKKFGKLIVVKRLENSKDRRRRYLCKCECGNTTIVKANYLILESIEFEYEPQCFKLANGKRYTPDFYIVKENKYIEIKGIPYSILDIGNQKHRVEMFRKTHNLDICYWEDIFEKCNLPYRTYGHYKIKADYIGITPEDYLGKMIYLTY